MSTQFLKLARAVAAATLAATLAAGASAAPIDINGGSSWGGWTNLGNSLTTGIWGAGPTVANGATSFNGYHTRFTYDSSVHLVAGGVGSGLAAANGDVIVGMGVQLVTANNSGSLFSRAGVTGTPGVYNVPTLKFDTNANSYTPSLGGIGTTQGQVSSSTFRDGDDFNVQMSTQDSAIYKVGNFNRIGPTNFGVAALAVAFGTLFDIDANSDDSFQIFVNLNQLPPLGVAAFNNFRVVISMRDSANAVDTQAVFFVSPSAAVPEPGTLALAGLALAGLCIARRRRTA